MNTSQKNFMVPLAFCRYDCFFAIWFWHWAFNSFLMPVLERSMEMSASESNLLLAATFCSIPNFGIPATKCIEAIGYKKNNGSFIHHFRYRFRIIHPSSRYRIYCMVSFRLIHLWCRQCSTPSVSKSICNYSWTYRVCRKTYFHHGYLQQTGLACYYSFITLVIGKTIDQIKWKNLFQPFGIIVGIFVVLGIIALMAPLPEVKAAGEDAATDAEEAVACPYAEGKTSIMQFPHLLLGVLALFLYVGVETIALATATGYAKALELPGDNYGFIPSIGMVVGYICGATLIPKYLSQATAMKICAIIAIIGSALVATMPAEIQSIAYSLWH